MRVTPDDGNAVGWGNGDSVGDGTGKGVGAGDGRGVADGTVEGPDVGIELGEELGLGVGKLVDDDEGPGSGLSVTHCWRDTMIAIRPASAEPA